MFSWSTLRLEDFWLCTKGSGRNTSDSADNDNPYPQDYSAQLLNASRSEGGKATSSSLPSFAYKADISRLSLFFLLPASSGGIARRPTGLRAAAIPLRLTRSENSIKSDLKYVLHRKGEEGGIRPVSRDYLPRDIRISRAGQSGRLLSRRRVCRQITHRFDLRRIVWDLAHGCTCFPACSVLFSSPLFPLSFQLNSYRLNKTTKTSNASSIGHPDVFLRVTEYPEENLAGTNINMPIVTEHIAGIV